MRKAIVPLIMLSWVSSASAAKSEALDGAIERALVYLQKTQEKDGSWEAGGDRSAAITGLSVMAFLSAGHVPGEGKYGAAIENGIRWVLARQNNDGLITTNDKYAMYHHGICTLLLAEVVGMCDRRLGQEVRRKLEKAVDLILRAQRTTEKNRGGWGYQPGDAEDYADLSIAGWQLLALRAAKNRGCDVPGEKIDQAVAYIQRCWDPNTGGFFYQPGHRLSSGCTGSGILSLEVCGKKLHRSRQTLAGGNYILNHPPRWGEHRFLYAVYYCSQGTFQLGGDYWKSYRPVLHRTLLPQQEKNGSWYAPHSSPEDRRFGPRYATAMGVLSLTVEYRYLPIYQRDEK